jgi:NAD(P)-dependent dehydrogenase (short-subunit alcohol dehydrogenase family)
MVMASFELAGRLDPREVTVNALHPGTLLDTKMVREGFDAPQGPVDIGTSPRPWSWKASAANTSIAPARHGRTHRPTMPRRAGGSGR